MRHVHGPVNPPVGGHIYCSCCPCPVRPTKRLRVGREEGREEERALEHPTQRLHQHLEEVVFAVIVV